MGRSTVSRKQSIHHNTFNRIYCTGAKYFDHQEVIFDGEASPDGGIFQPHPNLTIQSNHPPPPINPGFKQIPPNSHSLICFHPHGILTVGWALTNTNPVLGHAKIKWLATEALLRLPFISDFLSWNGAFSRLNKFRGCTHHHTTRHPAIQTTLAITTTPDHHSLRHGQ